MVLLRVEKLLASELEKINMELALLSTKEAEYDRLKRVLTRASAAADHYGSRVIEEQINLDIAKKTQLSSVRVIQSGERPVSPIFPRLFHVVMIALVGGVMLGTAAAVLLGTRRGAAAAADRGRFCLESCALGVESYLPALSFTIEPEPGSFTAGLMHVHYGLGLPSDYWFYSALGRRSIERIHWCS